MPKLQLYAVHDAAVGAFNNIMCFRSRGEAVRSFEDAVRSDNGGFGNHPEHFSFHYIGVYDSDTGLVEPVQPERIISASDFLFEKK